MNDERVVDEIITKFLLNTCRLRTHLNKPAVYAALHCDALANIPSPFQGDLNEDADAIPLTTGSVAEFYIEPMLPHIGDVDVMYHISSQLTIPRGQPPPTQLPDQFHNYVQVFEIIDSRLPGYVYLELRYLLTECVDENRYNAVQYDRDQRYLSNGWYIDRREYAPNINYDLVEKNDTRERYSRASILYSSWRLTII